MHASSARGPAANLVRDVPQGVDVDVLVLGFRDLRNLLHTCYADRGFPPRTLDVTVCEPDDNAIGISPRLAFPFDCCFGF